MKDFGVEGYGAYFILLELCLKKIEKDRDETLREDHLEFRFNERLVREKLRMRSTKVELFLHSCATKGLLEWTKVEDEFNFRLPKVLQLLDREAKRARPKSEKTGPEDKEKINRTKKENKEEVVGKPAPTAPVKNDFEIIPELSGFEPLDNVLCSISTSTQRQWLSKYKNADWLKDTLSNAVLYYNSKANGEAVTDWPLKLITWLTRDKSRPVNGKSAGDDYDFIPDEVST